jgi:hypothetical protein
MARLCSSQGLMRTGILVGALVGVLALFLLPVACRQMKSNASSADIDSKSLQQTGVVATLDGPLPEHKNAIWCSTFQMAWDKFKQDIIGEPIQVLGAEELANRLNGTPFPTGNIEEESYYTAAGFVKSGIIEQIQKDMRQRFPSEPVPTFDSRYTTLPDVALAYAYLNVDVGFKYPYFTCPRAFDFQSSGGAKTGVTAFSAATSGYNENEVQVRKQVEILFYDEGQGSDPVQFAVDLSQQTQPYQVILARMTRCNTLGDAAKALREKIAGFKNDPNYELLRKLRPIDTLMVPDVAYKVTHHFEDLLGKYLGNPKWHGYFIFEALQQIDFTLSRKGVVVKSSARVVGAAKSAIPISKLEEPRHLHFDRPFLICVQKREPNATPFFLMWVDNAELMQPYDKSNKS